MTTTQAAHYAIEQLLKEGVSVVSPKGRKEKIETVVRRALRTGTNQTAAKCQEENFFQYGDGLVETTSHLGARPSHAVWQGGVYEWVRAGQKKKTNYPDFLTSTGYGTGAGLCGWNCRHSFFPFYEGISERSFEKYDLKENEEIYKAEQEQRYNERQIRKYRQRVKIEKEVGMDWKEDQQRVNYWVKRQEAHLSKYDMLKRDLAREKARYSTGIISKILESGGEYRIGTNEVDLKYLKTAEFRNKFSRLTNNSRVNDSIRKYSEAMLTHRNGSDLEDLYIIDGNTGALIFRYLDSDKRLGVDLSMEQILEIRAYKGPKIVLHNHPSNIPPSGNDFVAAGVKLCDFGVVTTHDGRVHKYSMGDIEFKGELMDKRIAKYFKYPYNLSVEDAHTKVLNEFKEEYHISWKEMK